MSSFGWVSPLGCRSTLHSREPFSAEVRSLLTSQETAQAPRHLDKVWTYLTYAYLSLSASH